jgi:ABC-type dipeptide/oligopeptide/nickel transport system permease component
MRWGSIVRRLLLGIPTLLGTTIMVFSPIPLGPEDPSSALLPADMS